MKNENDDNPKKSKLFKGRKQLNNGLKKVLLVFGIEVSLTKKHPVHLTRRFFFWIIGFTGLVFIGSLGMYSYSTHPSFCRSCHIMQPYYNAWVSSKHEGKATCVDCHYPPATSFMEHLWHKFQATSQVVKYVTRTYSSKPFATVKDESCLRSGCHSKRLLEGKTFTPKGVRFDHGPHLQNKRLDRQLSCVSCHSQIVIGTHIEVTYATCYLCHFKGQGEGRHFRPLKGCMGCHETPTRDIQIGNTTYNHKDFVIARNVDCQNCHIDVVQGTGEAPKERCVDCHNDPARLARYDEETFIHEKHVTEQRAACHQCHLDITHKVVTTLNPTKPMETDCTLCHTDKHTGQKLMYMGIGAKDVSNMPSPMYTAQVDCIGCHFDPKTNDQTATFEGKNYEPTKQGCVICHGEDYLAIYDMWQDSVKSGLKTTGEKLTKAEAMLKNNSAKATSENWEIISDAKYNYEFVLKGHGIHNPDYAGAILDHINETLDKLLK